jgi:hypothetical protein
LQSVASYLRTLFLSPSTIFFDPLSTIASIIIYPVIFLFLFLAVVVLYVASLLVRWLGWGSTGCSMLADLVHGLQGFGRIMRALSNKWANGYSLINWVGTSTELVRRRG